MWGAKVKVYIGPYKNWIGPYQIADKVFFWISHQVYESDEEYDQKMSRWDYKLHSCFGSWLSKTWVNTFCNWIDSKKKRDIDIHIEEYDTWNMNHTLALIILPMLKQLRDTKHGSPYVEPEDVPHIGKGEKTDFGCSDDKVHERWEWIINEMIYAFEAEADEDWDQQFYSGESDISWEKLPNGNCEMQKGPKDTFKVDQEAMKADEERRKNGRILFGKYYGGLWD
jgi:hypothetical protein